MKSDQRKGDPMKREAMLLPLLVLTACVAPQSDTTQRTGALSTPHYIQGAWTTPQTSMTGVSVAFSTNEQAGDLVVVFVGWDNSTSSVKSITDTLGNTYALAVGPTRKTGSQSTYYALNVKPGPNTVTAAFNSSAPYVDLRLAEYSGLASFDKAVGAGGSSTSLSSGALTGVTAGDLLVAGSYIATGTTAGESGWTERYITLPDSDLVEDRTVATAGSYTATSTQDPTGWWVMQVAAFKASNTGGTGGQAGGGAGATGAAGQGGTGGSVEGAGGGQAGSSGAAGSSAGTSGSAGAGQAGAGGMAGGTDAGAGGSGGVGVFPLAASANGRYLVGQNGAPFFMVGDSAQTLIQDIAMTDAPMYFSTRKAQGFNTVLFELISKQSGGANPPGTATGLVPFARATDGSPYTEASARNDGQLADFSTPNDAYFAYAANLVDMAASYGFLVVLYPIPWGFEAQAGAGWWSDIVASTNSQAVCQAFGTYLANGSGGSFTGFAGRSNVLWLHGSDYGQQAPMPPSAEGEQRMLVLLNALVAGGATQLRSGDWEAPSISTDEPVFTSSMNVNGVYTYGGVWNGTPGEIPSDGTTYQETLRSWQYQPALPGFLKETYYEGSTLNGTTGNGTPTSLRKWHYWAILDGATNGLLYGNEQVWPFASGTWQAAITSPAAADVTRLGAFFDAIAWQNLVPSGQSGIGTLVTAGGSTFGNGDYVTAAASADGTLLVAYMPTVRTITVDMTKLRGPVTARWYDPTSGAYSTIAGSPFANSGTHAFAPAGANSAGDGDWLLLLQAQ